MKKTLAILATALTMSGAFAQASSPAAPAMSASAPAAKVQHEQRVEERIAYLHSQLKITSQQESQWNTFADVMRGNGQTMGELYRQRHDSKNVSALDDMKQYSEIATAHADGTKKLVDAFEPLYNSFSPEQKKLADTTFRESGQQHRAERPHRRHPAAKAPAADAASDANVKP
ncbi:Spy/CpxP family protein refolding chaperone [Paraburkholderia flava]|uniref:Spy/CpxP family protein refolding chaperone n=1 Tax=Paraburkholderia flava TaxID=2547393 RepID=UPI00105E7EA2|nr:Spy/CpxP family protein refolding chaperone [Paraburkholderia flava]